VVNVVQNKSDDTYNIIHDRNRNPREKVHESNEAFELFRSLGNLFYSVDKKCTGRQTSIIKQSNIYYFLVT
jgi:hypothetical protein